MFRGVNSSIASSNYGEYILDVTDGRNALAATFPACDVLLAPIADGQSLGTLATIQGSPDRNL